MARIPNSTDYINMNDNKYVFRNIQLLGSLLSVTTSEIIEAINRMIIAMNGFNNSLGTYYKSLKKQKRKEIYLRRYRRRGEKMKKNRR